MDSKSFYCYLHRKRQCKVSDGPREGDPVGDVRCAPRSLVPAIRRGQSCSKSCVDDRDCLKRQCLCDGACGLSCVSPNRPCPWPVSVDNARVRLTSGSQPTFGQWLEVTCLPGFRMPGGLTVSEHRCQADRNWSGSVPACKVAGGGALPCGEPPMMSEGFYQVLEPGPRHTVRYSCHPGYRLNGAEYNNCLENGIWARAAPNCRPIYCRPPSEIEHGVRVAVEKSRYRVGETVYYLCRKGYVTDGSNKVLCTQQGTWTTKPLCQAPCRVAVHRSRVLYQGRKVWINTLPGGRVRHLEGLEFYCLAAGQDCSYRVKTQCLNGNLPIPECYQESSWVRYSLFHWKVVSEMKECRHPHVTVSP
ncbi:beta-2-glycoprotein 1-like [Mustelus asterias]